MVVLLAWVDARAACLGGATNVAVIAAADEVSDAYGALDVPRFEAARGRTFELVPCLSEPLTSAGAAAVHRVVALDAFVAGDLPGVERAFRSVVAAYPSWRLPSDTVPRVHPLREAFDRAAAAPPGAVTALPVPLDATVLLDGRTSLDWPVDRPVVAQWLDGTGAVGWTRFAAAGEPPPDYVTAPEDARAAYLERNVIQLRVDRKPVELVVTAAALAAVSGGLYAGAVATRGQFEDPTTAHDRLDALRARTNGLVLGSSVAVAGALGTGALAIARW